MKTILFRADDAGSSHSANRAIRECVRSGVVRNVSFMVPGPAFEAAVELFAGISDFDRGLHVTLNSEWDRIKWGPVTPPHEVPSLVESDGAFTTTPAILHERGFSVAEAMTEVRAQLDYARQCGLAVDYLDEHMGVSWIGLGDGLRDLATREGIVYRPDLPYVSLGILECVADELVPAGSPSVAVFHPSHNTGEMRMVGNAEWSGATVARDRDLERLFHVDPRLPACLEKADRTSVRYSELDA